MENLLHIAKKEFIDLISNKVVLIILVFYLFLIIKSSYDFYDALSHGAISTENLAMIVSTGAWDVLADYGSLVGLVVGFSLISNEKGDNALNTLLVKPLYRDTIINGKFVGALGFIICLIGIAMALFISAQFIVSGSSFISIMPAVLTRIPIIFCLLIIYIMIYVAISMLITLVVKDQAFALISSFILMTIFELMLNVNFVGNIYYILSGSIAIEDSPIISFIGELSPYGVSSIITNSNFFNPSISLWSALQLIELEILRLLFYMVVAIILCYIVFIRSDIA